MFFFQDPSRIGFVFVGNKFAADPTLPFGTLAMPSFDLLDPEAVFVNVEENHFLCDCNRIAWFVAAAAFHFDRDVIEDIGDDEAGYEQNIIIAKQVL